MRSIKQRLILIFSGLILVSTLALGGNALFHAKNALVEQAETSLLSLSEETARLTVSRIDLQKRTLEVLALSSNMQNMDWNMQQTVLHEQLKNTDFLDMAVVQPNGTATYSNGETSQLGDRDYIQKALQGEANVSDVIISKVTNEPVIMYAAPIKNNGQVVGALIGRRDAMALSAITEDTGFGEEGYGYIINKEGTVVAHPDKDKVLNHFNPIQEVKENKTLKPVATLIEKVLKEKKGVGDYQFEGKELYASFAPILGTQWYFVITANQKEVLHALPSFQKTMLIIIFMVMMISIGITYYVGAYIGKPILAVAKVAEKIAELNIRDNISPIILQRKDETGKLGQALQDITESLRGIIKEINHSAEQVTSTSSELTANAQQSAMAAEEVSVAIEEIANSATGQAQKTDEGSSRAALLGQAIEQNQNYLVNLSSSTDKVGEVLEQGVREMEYLTEKTEDSNRSTMEIYEVILKTNESSNKISQASNVISSIAQQTNLLSLNAAIEAARAGEAGKGFAVVAEEIRNLADQSATSTKEIDEMVRELQVNAQEAVRTIETMSNVILKQAESVKNSKSNFLGISQSIQEALYSFEVLQGSGLEMEKMKVEIQQTLEHLSVIAEENSASTQEITASVEEQTASVEEIANASENLAELAKNLQEMIKKFKI